MARTPPRTRRLPSGESRAASGPRSAFWLLLFGLAAAYLASAVLKLDGFLGSPQFSSSDDTALFWSESSFHYRYARMIARGESVPDHDRDAEWPEGVAPRREFTMGMEDAAGWSYRLLRPFLGATPFHAFLAGFISFWSSVTVLVAFAASAAVWRSWPAGLIAAFAYALTPVTISRTIWNFVREDFALPFLFGAFALFVAAAMIADVRPPKPEREPRARALAARFSARFSESRAGRLFGNLAGRVPERELVLLSAGCGLALAAGLATWHLARFFLLVFATILIPVLVLASPGSRRGMTLALMGMLLAAGAAGVAIPVLREKRLLLSPAFLLLAGITISAWTSRGPGVTRGALVTRLAVGAALALGLSRVVPGAEGEYSHVTGLIAAKLRFLGRKPADPSLLTDDARVFWVGPFDTPSAGMTLLTFSTMTAWAPIAIVLALRRALARRLSSTQALVLLATLAFGTAFLLIERLSVFFVFFAAILLPAALAEVAGARRRAVLATLAILALYEVAYLRSFHDENPWRRWVVSRFGLGATESVPNLGNTPRVVAWMRRFLPDDAPVLTWFPTGPLVLTDTGRPIILNPMFESSRLRAKERRMRGALYDSGEALFALCEEWGAAYVLYQANLLLDTSLESYRYMANRRSVPVASAAFRMHFAPETLDGFDLVYQDSYYRLFRVVSAGAARDSSRAPLPYEEMFDASPLGSVGEVYPDDRSPRVLARVLDRATLMQRALAEESQGRPREAERLYREILARSPDAADALLRLSFFATEAGRLDEALALAERGLSTRPHFAELHYARGLALERRGEREAAVAAYREALALSPAARAVRERLAFLDPGSVSARRGP